MNTAVGNVSRNFRGRKVCNLKVLFLFFDLKNKLMGKKTTRMTGIANTLNWLSAWIIDTEYRTRYASNNEITVSAV